MGVLDEAIREHLELKRQHGADPTEVARQENEALGPARREAESADSADDFVVGRDVSQGDTSQAVAEPEVVEPEVVEFEPLPVRRQPEPEPEALRPEPEPEPEPRRIDPDPIDQPTVEHPAAKPEPLVEDEIFDVDDTEGPAAAESDDDDPLERTPGFLEETPEHDRLWFEQRPPRDFDFDD